MSARAGASELEAIRHDLKNVLTEFRSGCMLIGSRLDPTEHREVHALLEEMRATLERGSALVDRLRRLDPSAGGGRGSGGSSEVRQQ
jgi:hypothetical protein